MSIVLLCIVSNSIDPAPVRRRFRTALLTLGRHRATAWLGLEVRRCVDAAVVLPLGLTIESSVVLDFWILGSAR